MLYNPFIGLGAQRLAFPRRDRHMQEYRYAFGNRSRQTVGHNLLTGLGDFWPLSELMTNSGVRTGMHNGFQLTGGVNQPTAAGNGPTLASNFNGINGIQTPDNVKLRLSTTLGVTIAIWSKFASTAANQILICKDNAVTPGREYSLFWTTAPQLRWEVNDAGNYTATSSFVRATFTPTIGTWYFIVCRFDPPNSRINLNVNNGAVMNTNGSLGPTPITTTSPFYVAIDGRATPIPFSGLEQRAAMWQRALTDDEVTYLWNGGKGMDYPFIV